MPESPATQPSVSVAQKKSSPRHTSLHATHYIRSPHTIKIPHHISAPSPPSPFLRYASLPPFERCYLHVCPPWTPDRPPMCPLDHKPSPLRVPRSRTICFTELHSSSFVTRHNMLTSSFSGSGAPPLGVPSSQPSYRNCKCGTAGIL